MGRKAIDGELEEQLALIISMIKDGAKDKEIIETLGISASTWKRKKAQNTKIKEALEELTDARNQQVEESLFKVCTGYSYYEEVVTKVKEEVLADDGETILTKEDVKISKVKKYRGPDINAQKYWLNNKKKAVWKDDPHKVENDKKLTKLKAKDMENKEKLMKQFEDD
ncbi:Xaa-His dipeptidase [Clostridium sp. BSD9I1]|uniref:Xaa-His dipeptidase n=1 Tax=Clostridium sp. BSD9I1 TaxID=2003589 RepID=UPI00164963BC|nr:Xaa-His dipeptidase [Clostridium sp. BSD9I1]